MRLYLILSLEKLSPYSIRMRQNEGQNNSEYGHFLRSAYLSKKTQLKFYMALDFHYSIFSQFSVI